MSGIDKITFTLPYYDDERVGADRSWGEWNAEEGVFDQYHGLRLDQLLSEAERRTGYNLCVKEVRGERGYFAGFNEMPGFLVKHRGRRLEENPFVTRIEINPSHFQSFRQFQQFMGFLNEEVSWVNYAPVTRIDFAADYRGALRDLSYGIDFPYRRSLNFYVRIANGMRESMTVGAHPDVITAYARFYEQYNRGEMLVEDREVPVLRIERQLRTASKIREVLGYTLTYATLEEALERLLNEEFSFFGIGVTLGNVSLLPLTQWHENTYHERRMRFDTLARYNSYFEARKYLNENRNFQRDYRRVFSRTLLPSEQQPNHVFSTSLRRYLSSRRRTLWG